jgi:tryptophan synthase beta chain
MSVRDFQAVIGRETMDQLQERTGRRSPDAVVACVGGGSNAIGIFAPYAYLPADERPRLIGVEAAGHGMDSGAHAASISAGKRGVLHGALMYLLSDDDGQISPAHSVSAGLDYPGVGPEHSWYADEGIAEYVAVDDQAALRAFRLLAEVEGIIPALETSHAIAYVVDLAAELGPDADVVLNLSGRGDKDVTEAMRVLEALNEDAAGAAS